MDHVFYLYGMYIDKAMWAGFVVEPYDVAHPPLILDIFTCSKVYAYCPTVFLIE
jgi:hypothetical protein